MKITKCDNCGKEIETNNINFKGQTSIGNINSEITVEIRGLAHNPDLCLECAINVVNKVIDNRPKQG